MIARVHNRLGTLDDSEYYSDNHSPLLVNWFKTPAGITIWAASLTSVKLSFVSPGNSKLLSVVFVGSFASNTEIKSCSQNKLKVLFDALSYQCCFFLLYGWLA